MSYVTSVVIVVDWSSTDFEAAVTAPSDFGRGEAETQFRAINMDGAGGTKYPGTDVYAAGLNYADREALIAWLDALPWSSWGVVTIDSEGSWPIAKVYGVGGKRVTLNLEEEMA